MPERNGVGTYYEDLMAQLVDQLGEIELVAPQGKPKAAHERFSIPLPGDKTQRLAYPRTKVLRKRMEEGDVNVVIIPSLGAYSYYGLRMARKLGAGVIVAHHTNFDRLVDLYWPRILAWPTKQVIRSLTNWLIRRADVVVTMNVESLQDARARGAKDAKIVGTPLSTRFVHEPMQPRLPTPRRAVFVGRLAAEKGIGDILNTAERRPDYQFVIVGDGPLRNRVEQAEAKLDNLSYRGWQERDGVMKAIDESDILILPSSIETFGTVALEALARQRYVLVHRNCGISHWPSLAQGLFTIQEGEDINAALLRIDSLGEERDAIAKRGWDAVRQFNQSTLDGWIEVLSHVGRHSRKGHQMFV